MQQLNYITMWTFCSYTPPWHVCYCFSRDIECALNYANIIHHNKMLKVIKRELTLLLSRWKKGHHLWSCLEMGGGKKVVSNIWVSSIDSGDVDDENSSRGSHCITNGNALSRNVHHYPLGIIICIFLMLLSSLALLMAAACYSITAWCCELGDEMVMKCEKRRMTSAKNVNLCRVMKGSWLCGFSHSLTHHRTFMNSCDRASDLPFSLDYDWSEEMPHINGMIYKWNIIFCILTHCICIYA